MGPEWSPEVYGRHAAPRLRPALDLLGRIPIANAETVVDLGCGSGALFPALRARFATARLMGIDSSPAMLERARAVDPDVELVEAGPWQTVRCCSPSPGCSSSRCVLTPEPGQKTAIASPVAFTY